MFHVVVCSVVIAKSFQFPCGGLSCCGFGMILCPSPWAHAQPVTNTCFISSKVVGRSYSHESMCVSACWSRNGKVKNGVERDPWRLLVYCLSFVLTVTHTLSPLVKRGNYFCLLFGLPPSLNVSAELVLTEEGLFKLLD